MMELIKYISVQVCAYIIDIGGFYLINNIENTSPLISNLIGKSAAGTFAFFSHRLFTFKANQGGFLQQAVRFTALLLLHIPIATAILALLLYAGLPVLFAKFLSDVASVALSFWLSKRFVFQSSRPKAANTIAERGDF
ncbi:GtrA family protein [Pseudohoeflea coraliihabitans]|uniref:GtrA family protein n=1 Tax=Pseudohoeflea coraliihabitans TaxID=2860393 RepID=A0ABS6WP85_9HYPH|nr:GtrA family protein [Pseudohoeflea sp. DP4N28-3]MBW3096884.1 GtrA family protein [Pseudohoeflea sp. DP4N28-3]